jgi:hypothetical protein
LVRRLRRLDSFAQRKDDYKTANQTPDTDPIPEEFFAKELGPWPEPS